MGVAKMSTSMFTIYGNALGFNKNRGESEYYMQTFCALETKAFHQCSPIANAKV